LKDDRFICALAQQAREVFNWHCADLIKTFANIAKMKWNGTIYPGSSIEQLGFDLLCRILVADVERYYVIAMNDVKNNQYGKIPWTNNTMDLLFTKHRYLSNIIIPDQSHIYEYLHDTRDKVQELTFLINQAHSLIGQVKETTKWMTKVYPDGIEPMELTTEQGSHFNWYVTHIEANSYGNSMHPYAANHRCIHCQGTHASEDHHLSVSVPIVSNSGHPILSTIQEEIETSSNRNTPDNYKKTQFLLPSQQLAFTTQQIQQWPLPPRPTPPTASREWQGYRDPLTPCQGFGKGEGKGLCFSTPPNPSLHMFTLHTPGPWDSA
jgi:hypothetical protein